MSEVSPDRYEPEGGDPVCWLPHVCFECGRFVEDDPPTTCPRCGATLEPE